MSPIDKHAPPAADRAGSAETSQGAALSSFAGNAAPPPVYRDHFYDALDKLVISGIEGSFKTDVCRSCGAPTWPAYSCGRC